MNEERVVRAAVAPLQSEPRAGSEQISQLLRGHAVLVHETSAEWTRVAGRDGYPGWMHRGYLAEEDEVDPSDADAFSLGCTIISGDRTIALPFGALVFAEEGVIDGAGIPLSEAATRFPRDATAVVETALSFFCSAPYHWGGVTPWGADCSGFVQAVFGAHGILLARDASDQSAQGSRSHSTPGQNLKGDLLFFHDGDATRITHVGMALGSAGMAHVAIGRGGFAVEDFGTAEGDSYQAKLRDRFAFARRVL
jgi:hypothetical protein